MAKSISVPAGERDTIRLGDGRASEVDGEIRRSAASRRMGQPAKE
ncbi:hypothetical protein [Thermanaerovibrio velox]|jgi:hypothetical protein|nr:hypothetical protein [Thermanaerovibrio velox]